MGVLKKNAHKTRRLLVLILILLSLAGSFAVNAIKTKPSKTNNDEIIITVGKTTYQKPYQEKYGTAVAEALADRPTDESDDVEALYGQADWLIDLGIAHRSILESAVDYHSADFGQIGNAIDAFQAAVPVYQQIRDQYEEHAAAASERLAEVFFNIGETYSLSPVQEEYGLAMEFLIQSELLYREELADEQTDSWDEATRAEIEIRWAHCCHRIGISLLSMDGGMAAAASADLLNDPEQLEEHLEAGMDQLLDNIHRAEVYLNRAIGVYEKAAKKRNHREEQIELDRYLASSWQNLGTALTMRGDAASGVEYSAKALKAYQELFPRLSPEDLGTQDAKMDIGDIMYTLAEQHLQLGSYDNAKEQYTNSMNWHEDNELSPPEVVAPDASSDFEQTLEVVELQLSAYNDLWELEAKIDIGEDEEFYERNDGYEGDLHLSLGSLYMDKGDLVTATSHLIQAIKLYELDGENEERNTADAKYNLAILHFRTGEYGLSDDMYKAALEIYQKAVGDGVDPRMMGMDLDQLDARASARVNEKENKKAKKVEAETKKRQVKEPLVDVDDYKESLKNATAMKDEL